MSAFKAGGAPSQTPLGELTALPQNPGFVSCKKKNRNAKNMASAGARAYMGVWGRCP